jgi:drug/metabolite transporter (DMT)-like permease
MRSESRKKWLGLSYVLLAGAGFGFLGIFGRWAFRSGLSVGELLTYRFTIAALLLWSFLLLFRPQFIKLPLKQILISAALGVFGYAVFSTLYFKAIEGVSVPLAALLLFTFPLFVNIGAVLFLKEKLAAAQWLSLLLASCGLLVLLWGPLSVNSFSAVICALTAAITYAIYVLLSGIWQKDVRPISSSLYVISAAALALLAVHHPSPLQILGFTTQQVFLVLGIALISTIGPLTLFLAGLQKLSSSEASISVMIEPVVATLAAGLILNEQLSPRQLLGSLLVLAALGLNALKK